MYGDICEMIHKWRDSAYVIIDHERKGKYRPVINSQFFYWIECIDSENLNDVWKTAQEMRIAQNQNIIVQIRKIEEKYLLHLSSNDIH